MNKISPATSPQELYIRENVSLKAFNSFQVDAYTSHLAEIYSVEQLKSLLEHKIFNDQKKLILGGGSNILFKGNFKGLVVRICIPGVKLIKEDEHHVWIRVGAGVNWHEFIMYCLKRELAGLENLSLIPGSVGAAPIQNIGAYGVEQDQFFHQLEAIDIQSGKFVLFEKEDCGFTYRDSVFKNGLKNRFIISSVTYRLNKKPDVNINYGNISEKLQEMKVHSPTIHDVSDAVCQIRRSKLPDPAELGNSGSFFKNPIVNQEVFQALIKRYPGMVNYPLTEGEVKIPAGWLIEQSGWKGKTIGSVGTHKKQALVIVNYGGASGNEIYDFAMQVKATVHKKYGISLIPEVNIL
ncbi:MAG: UDP-N-acetylmuramate dehydrogenase [Balneolales bacterium]